MKDYCENKIKQIKEQIKELEKEIDTTEKEIDFNRQCLQRCNETMICAPKILRKNIEYYQCKIRSIRRDIAALEEEIDKTDVQRQQKNQYKTKCSADEGYDELDIMLIIGRNGFIRGTRL